MVKECIKCGEVKPINEFQIRRKVLSDGQISITFRNECKQCQKRYMNKYYAKNKEQLVSKQQDYKRRNEDRIKKWQRDWYARNRDRVLAQTRNRYKSSDKNLVRLYKALYREQNRGAVRRTQSNWRNRNADICRVRQKNYEREARKEIRPRYVKHILKHYHGFSENLINDPDFIELYRLIISSKRLLKNNKSEKEKSTQKP